MNKPLIFRGGGGNSYTSRADTLATNDTVEVLLGIGEGPVKGPVSGPQSFYADNTALVNPNNEPNFGAFSLDFWPGSPTGDTVAMLTGGFSSPVQVGQALFHTVPVARTGLQTGITAVDFGIVVNNLEHSDNKGTGVELLKLLFEYAGTDGVWHPCFTSAPGGTSIVTTTNSSTTNWALSENNSQIVSSFSGDRPVTTYTSPSDPAPTQAQAVAIDSSGNVYHYDIGSSVWSAAIMTAGTGTYANWNDVVGSTTVVRKVYKASTSAPTNPAPKTGDIWIQTAGAYFIYNGSAWVQPNAYAVYTPTAQPLTNGVWSISAKITSPTTITIRCMLPTNSAAYSYRVTKQVPDDTTTDFTDVTWESFSEIIQSSYTFNSLAMMKVLGQASDQFTSLPNWTTLLEGRLVKVPSNYDPVARTYTGIWDGTYKIAYTNNTAFIFKDFVENSTFGLSKVYPHTCNPWSIYEWAQFCDVMVLKGDGTYQPRWTYNDYVTQPRDAREMANYIAGAASAIMVDDGAGYVDVLIDDPAAPAVALFTPENIGPEGFGYSYTDRLTRANQIIVSFPNPQVNYQTDKRVEQDDDDIEVYGTITDDIVAVGCNDVDEALRRARSRLITGLTETEINRFSTNRKGKYLSQWQVILCADPTLARGLSGRVSSVVDTHTVNLRDPITLEAGFSYSAVFEIMNPDYGINNDDTPFATVTIPITTPAGTVTQLAFSSALPTLPEFAVFAIECAGIVGTPVPYKITNIEDAGGDGENIVITALQLNRSKQSFIDGQTTQIVNPSFPLANGSYVNQPTNLDVEVVATQNGVSSINVLTLSWSAPASSLLSYYNVHTSLNGTSLGTVQTTDTSFQINGANYGNYTFEVEAVNLYGRSSIASIFQYDCTGVARYVPPPTALTLLGGTSSTTFNTKDALFSWTPPSPTDPLFAYYQVQVVDATSGTVVRTVNAGNNPTWTYDYGTNTSDGLRRSFIVDVVAVDQLGNLSAPLSITVNNPVPLVPVVSWIIGSTQLQMSFQTPSDPDYAGVNVWASTSSGFTPGPSNQVWNGPGQPIIQTSPSTTLYVVYQFYDSFGLTGCPVSAQIAETTIALPLGVIPTPAVPTGLGLTTSISTNSQTVTLTAAWTANTDTGFSYYELALQQGAGAYIVFPTSSLTYAWTVPANTAFNVKIRSVNSVGNRSAYSSVVSLTSAADTTPPAAPTFLSALGSFGAIYLAWTNPTASDLDHIEVWENTTNNNATASRIDTVNAVSAQAGGYTRSGLATGVTNFYWVKAVDTSGNASGFSTVATASTVGVSPSDLSTTPPAVPTGLALFSAIQLDTDQTQQATLAASWNPVSGAVSYNVSLTRVGGNTTVYSAPTAEYRWVILGNVSYSVTVEAVNAVGVSSAASSPQTITSLADTTPPAVATGFGAFAAITSIFLSWTNPADIDFDHVEVWANSVNNSGTAYRIAMVAGAPSLPGSYTNSAIATGTTIYYWLKAVDTSGNASGFSAVASATTAAVGTTDIGPNSITTGKIAAGAITTTQLAASSVLAGNIAAGAITTTQLAANAVLAGNIAAGAITTTQIAIGTIQGLNIAGTTITGANIASGSISTTNLAAASITTSLLAAGAVTAFNIAAGTITAVQIAAGSITGDRFNTSTSLPGTITVGSTGVSISTIQSAVASASAGGNRVNLSQFEAGMVGWEVGYDPTSIGTGIAENTYNGKRSVRLNFTATAANQVLSIISVYPQYNFRVTPGEILAFAGLFESSNCGLTFTVHFYDGSNAQISQPTVCSVPAGLYYPSTPTGSWAPNRYGGFLTVPGGAVTAFIEVYATSVAAGSGWISMAEPFAGSVTAAQTILPAFSPGPVPNPAAVINANSTTINPGLVLISGATTLANWQQGGDLTKIAGGAISANTITANLLQIGNRGVDILGLQFQANSPTANTIYWSAGTISYVDNTGVGQTQAVAGGSAAWTAGTVFIYWDTSSPGTLQATSTFANVYGPTKIVMATYQGGTNMVVNYGRTIVDGSNITTGTVTANAIAAGTLTGVELSASAVLTVGSGNNSTTISGVDSTYLQWAGAGASSAAPYKLHTNGQLETTSMLLKDINGVVWFDSSNGGFSNAAISAFYLNSASNSYAATSTAFITGTGVVTTGAAGSNGASAPIRFSASVPATIYLNGQITNGSAFSSYSSLPSSITMTGYYRFSTDGSTWPAWTSLGAATLTRPADVAIPNNSSLVIGGGAGQYAIFKSTYSGSTTYEVIDSQVTVSTSTTTGIGYYEFCGVSTAGSNPGWLPSTCNLSGTFQQNSGTPAIQSATIVGESVPYVFPIDYVSNLIINNGDSNYSSGSSLGTITVTADVMTLTNGSGLVETFTGVSLSATPSGVGVNGVDIGTFSGSGYSVYAIYNGSNLALLFSQSEHWSGVWMPPAGYTFYKRLGTVSALWSSLQRGKQVTIKPVRVASGALGSVSTPSYSTISLASYIPTISATAKLLATSAGNSGQVMLSGGTTTAASDTIGTTPPGMGTAASNASVAFSSIPVEVVLEKSQTVYAATTANTAVYLTGYTEP